MRCIDCRHRRGKEIHMIAATQTLPSREHPGRWEQLTGVRCPHCGRFVSNGQPATLISQGEAHRRGLPELLVDQQRG